MNYIKGRVQIIDIVEPISSKEPLKIIARTDTMKMSIEDENKVFRIPGTDAD